MTNDSNYRLQSVVQFELSASNSFSFESFTLSTSVVKQHLDRCGQFEVTTWTELDDIPQGSSAVINNAVSSFVLLKESDKSA